MKNNTLLLLGLVGVAAYFLGKKASASTINPAAAFGPGTQSFAPTPEETGAAIPIPDMLFKPEPENPYGPITKNNMFPWAMEVMPLMPATKQE